MKIKLFDSGDYGFFLGRVNFPVEVEAHVMKNGYAVVKSNTMRLLGGESIRQGDYIFSPCEFEAMP